MQIALVIAGALVLSGAGLLGIKIAEKRAAVSRHGQEEEEKWKIRDWLNSHESLDEWRTHHEGA